MGEPARKIREDIEPDIKPDLHVVKGGGETTPGRANLKALESNPDKTDSKSSIKNQEEAGSNVVQGPWANKTTGRAASALKAGGKFSFIKKKGPLGIVIAAVMGIFGLGASFYPVALTQGVYSNLIDKFNIQETSATLRSNRIITSKLSGELRTGCTGVLTIACKFTRPSNRFLDQLEKNGIRALDREGNTITKSLFPNTKPSRYQFTSSTGEIIDATADELPAKLANNAEFRDAMHKSSKTRFMSLADDVFDKIKAKFGFSTDNKLANVADDVANTADDVANAADDLGDDIGDDVANALDDKVDDAARVIDDSIGNLGDDAARVAANSADDVVKSNFITRMFSKTATEAAEAVGKVGAKSGDTTTLVASVVCGFADVPGMITKSIRSFQMMQLVRYSAIILATFGAIRAFEALPEESNAIGNLLTNVVDGKSAMDSDSINYVMNNSLPSGENYKKFIPGASIIAALGGVVLVANSEVKKVACGTMTNPLTGQAINSALLLNSGETLGTTAALAAINMAAAYVLSEVITTIATETDIIPNIIAEVTKHIDTDKLLEYFVGDLTTGLSGESVGDALVSGASHTMGQTANSGGNMPLTVKEAIAYQETTKEVQLAYAEEDRATKSPFDITSRYTMMGSLLYSITPYLVKGYQAAGVISNSISSIASFISGSFALLFNPTGVNAIDASQEYQMCEDPEMQEYDIAAGPYCNIIYGVPSKYLDKDPYDLAEKLIADGQIDAETGDPIEDSEYEDWLTLCTTGDTYTARNCKVDDSNADYAVYTIDHRIQIFMDEESQSTSSTSGGSTDTGDSSQPDNTTASNKGWTLKTNTDYSGVACAEGTTDIGVFTTGKHDITVRVCQMPDGLTKVSSLISKRTLNMINKAKEDGVSLKAKGQRSSFRSYDDQMYFRKQNCPDPLNSPSSSCSPPTALPGSSMHERGLAVDFANSTKGGAVWNWLEENAASYGYFNLPSENWHWSMSGK